MSKGAFFTLFGVHLLIEDVDFRSRNPDLILDLSQVIGRTLNVYEYIP